MENNNKTQFEVHSFKTFLERYNVEIPLVQRDYAQGRETDDVKRVRSRFLDAIYDHLDKMEQMKMDFVYGEINKVWSKKEANRLERVVVTPLDGQQRLTTLYLLHWFAARKAKVGKNDYSFLAHFTYEIRPSSRDFCTHLMNFEPTDKEKYSNQIKDQHWFMAEWHNDPTILSMLVMLDAIKDKFEGIGNLWELLTEKDTIIFYFLPLNENGLSDELYIKMNSRGKKLTPFEHFKAEYESLYVQDPQESNDINHRFDVEWIDILFPYRNQDNTVDREFMRYFFYISHILCYQQNKEKSNDEFKLIKLLYDGNCKDVNPNPQAAENRQYLKDALNCWHEVYKNGGIDNFFRKYLSFNSYEKGKVATYKWVAEYRNCQNYFNACIKLYQVNNNFSYGDFLFLFGIITYLMNKEKVTEKSFIERLRILRNLIMNSNAGEIRGDADVMRDLLDEVRTLILQGNIKTGLSNSFNGLQESEEREKREKKTFMSDSDINQLYKFEDHPLVFGFVSGFGYDNLKLVDEFYELFSEQNNHCTIHRALISIDDYTQKAGDHYYMGNYNRSTWTALLHSRSRSGFVKTMEVLVQLLKRLQSGESVDDVINKFVEEQAQARKYTWRYYFAKYADMLRGADGELVWGESDYIVTTLNKHQFNGQHWNSFLNVVFQKVANWYKNKEVKKQVVGLGNYGEDLNILTPVSSLKALPDGFLYSHGENKTYWNVNQDEQGIDQEDRIDKAFLKVVGIIDSIQQ